MSENDVFSALNIGSGLNTTELIQNLLLAERAPKEEKINEKIEENEVSISAIAELKKFSFYYFTNCFFIRGNQRI